MLTLDREKMLRDRLRLWGLRKNKNKGSSKNSPEDYHDEIANA